MLCIGIFGVHNRWCAATLVNYILVAIFLWCNVSSVHCIFGVMYMHLWYAMHRQLWWCLVGVITIVQCIFGALSLGLGFNIFFFVLRLWCYALSCQLCRAGLLLQWRIYFIYYDWKSQSLSFNQCKNFNIFLLTASFAYYTVLILIIPPVARVQFGLPRSLWSLLY